MKYYANEKYAEGGLKNDLTIFYTKENGKFKAVFVTDYLDTGEIDSDNRKKDCYTSDIQFSIECKNVNTAIGCYDGECPEGKQKEFDTKISYNKSYYAVNLWLNKKILNNLTGNLRYKLASRRWSRYNHENYILFVDIEGADYEIKPVITSMTEYHKTVENMIVVGNSRNDKKVFLKPDNNITLKKGVYIARELTLLNEDTYKMLGIKKLLEGRKIESISYATSSDEEKLINLMSLAEVNELLKRDKARKEEAKRKYEAARKEEKRRIKKRCLHFIKRLGQVKALFDSGVIYKRIDKYKEKYNKTLNSLAMLNSRYELNLKDEAMKINVIY